MNPPPAATARVRHHASDAPFDPSVPPPASRQAEAVVARLETVSRSLPEPEEPQTRRVPGRTDRPFRGIGLILLSTLFLGTSDVTAKYLAATLPAVEIGWIRFVVFAVLMMPAMIPGTPLYSMSSARPGLQVLRGAALLGSSLMFISGLAYLPIAEASATAFVSPLFVTALSIVFLGESVGVRRWIATAVGLCGVLIILRPGTSAFHPAAFFPLASALSWAVTLVLTRMMSGRDAVITTMAYSSITGAAILTLLVPFVWVTPTWTEVMLCAFIGLASTVGHWIVVIAFRHADASVLAPFSYTQLVVVSLFGFFLFKEVPDLWTIIGAAFIVGSGLYTAHRERVRRLKIAEVAAERSPNP